MLRKKLLHVVTIFFLVVITATSCKKDLFNEKDAIAAQTDLLNLKYAKDADLIKLKFSNDLILKNIDVQIKNIDLQIQRVSDSAQFALLRLGTTLRFSADSAMERIRQANALAQILQSYQNQRLLALQADSLARNMSTFYNNQQKANNLWYDSLYRAQRFYNDSVTLAQTDAAAAKAAIEASKAILRAMTKDYSVTVIDNFNTIVEGATVSVYPYGSTTLLTAKTDSRGVARFTGIIVDPAAQFAISGTGYAGYLLQERYFTDLGKVPVKEGTLNYERTHRGTRATMIDLVSENAANAQILATTNTISGSVKGNLDLTNGGLLEAVGGHMVTFSANMTIKYLGEDLQGTYTISALSDKTTGMFSVKVPDGTWTASYDKTIEADQKLFVKAWSDEDVTKAVPSIRTIGATLALTGSSIEKGTGIGYYLKIAKDSITGREVIVSDYSTTTGAKIEPYDNDYTNTSNTNTGFFENLLLGLNPRTDSLNYNASLPTRWFFSNTTQGNVAYLNNNNVDHYVDKSVRWSRAKRDTIDLTLVSLVSGWIQTAPLLKATTRGGLDDNNNLIGGILDKFMLSSKNMGTVASPDYQPLAGAGGKFNNSAMYDKDRNPLFLNVYAGSATYLQNLVPSGTVTSINATSFTVSKKGTVYLPIEYKSTISRAKKPI
jgi:hypothetical protein